MIRRETENDYRAVEELTRRAFWNIYFPGTDAHYLIHTMRNHPDFLPELDYVAVLNGIIVGSIVYTRSHVADDRGHRIDTLTFGPISVLPNYQRQGVGSKLILHTLNLAAKLGAQAVVIYGNPSNYSKFGFVGSKKLTITNPQGRYPCSLLVKELKPGIFREHGGKFYESDVFHVDPAAAERFDQGFEPWEKGYDYHQEEFEILSRAFVE